jgi:hypothetical protein
VVGETGPRGPQGIPGSPAPIAGLSYSSHFQDDTRDIKTVDANCPDGKQAISGGYYTDAKVFILQNMPVTSRTSWRVKAWADGAFANSRWTLEVWAICVTKEPAQ